jgi:hypothetical protein
MEMVKAVWGAISEPAVERKSTGHAYCFVLSLMTSVSDDMAIWYISLLRARKEWDGSWQTRGKEIVGEIPIPHHHD